MPIDGVGAGAGRTEHDEVAPAYFLDHLSEGPNEDVDPFLGGDATSEEDHAVLGSDPQLTSRLLPARGRAGHIGPEID